MSNDCKYEWDPDPDYERECQKERYPASYSMTDRETYESRLRQIERLRDAVIEAAREWKREWMSDNFDEVTDVMRSDPLFRAIDALEAAEKNDE